MRKLRPIGTLPPVLQFVILLCLSLGFVGSLNALFGNLVYLACLPLIALGFGIWHWSDKAAERKEGAKKTSVVARAKVGSPSMEAAPAVSGPTVADYEGALKDLQAMMAAETDEAKRAKLSAAVEQVETQLADARMAAAAETKVTEADDASMRELIAAFERVVDAKAEGLENATGSSLAPRATLPTPNVIGAPDFCPDLLTGQLVARYKKTHDEDYQAEYERRLRSIGFTEQEAKQLFVFELMILKHDAIERLASPGYLTSSCFDLQHPLLTQDESWYVEHQRFLCSEITKIWDEAEWHYWNSHEREDLPNDVWGEIYRISRYGGGKLLVDYLTMLSEKSGIDMAKIQAYSAAEQQLVFAYKWNRGKRERHPYPAGQGTATAGDTSRKPSTASAPQATSTVSQSKKGATTAKAQEARRRAEDVYFADPEDVFVCGDWLASTSGDTWEVESVYVRFDPFRHCYGETIEQERFNFHGTDSTTKSYARSITADEAIAALASRHAAEARQLERFEQSCARANAACEDLLRREYPGWTVEEVLYNSYNCTLLRVRGSDGQECALKVSRGDGEDVQRRRNFARALEAAGGCAHIVGLEDIRSLPVSEDGEQVLVERMPLLRPAYDVSGGPVSSRSYANVAHTDGRGGSDYLVALDVARALAKMHELGYVHMDVRPENILVDSEGRFVLADLASVRMVSEQYEGTLQTSTEFRAPEIARHEPFSTDADVFAWGRCMLFAVMGKPKRSEHPEVCVYTVERGYGSAFDMHCDGTFEGWTDQHDVEDLLAMALKACSQDRGERYRDGAELVAALESIA